MAEKTATKLSKPAERVIEDLIVNRGLSYTDAARKAREQGYIASRPYLEAAAEIERWMARGA